MAEVGPIHVLPFVQMLTADPEESWEDGHDAWDEDNYNELTGAGYVATAPEDEEPGDEELGFLEDEDLATALLAMAECDNDETPAEGLDELASAAQQLFVGYGRWHPQGQEQRQRKAFWERHEQQRQRQQLRTASSA